MNLSVFFFLPWHCVAEASEALRAKALQCSRKRSGGVTGPHLSLGGIGLQTCVCHFIQDKLQGSFCVASRRDNEDVIEVAEHAACFRHALEFVRDCCKRVSDAEGEEGWGKRATLVDSFFCAHAVAEGPRGPEEVSSSRAKPGGDGRQKVRSSALHCLQDSVPGEAVESVAGVKSEDHHRAGAVELGKRRNSFVQNFCTAAAADCELMRPAPGYDFVLKHLTGGTGSQFANNASASNWA
jgi:hypothetical protein